MFASRRSGVSAKPQGPHFRWPSADGPHLSPYSCKIDPDSLHKHSVSLHLFHKYSSVSIHIRCTSRNCSHVASNASGKCGCVLSRFSHAQSFVTVWTIARQAPLSLGFPRQEYWSGVPFPSPGDLPDPGVVSGSPAW